MRPALLPLLFLLVACAGPPDEDGDGYDASLDCDDGDPGVNPGASERCDGVDQDCDGTVDETAVDGSAWYVDQDGDGVGQGSALIACARPEGAWAGVRGDCDDDRADVFPGAEETCDGFDEDCDGETDEDFVCGERQCDDELDNDEDGRTDCDDPDCDGACPEVCDDGRDNDGDGDTDCADEDCWPFGACVEEDCSDGEDDEGDGLADCDDPDCWGSACPEAVWRVTGGSAAASQETIAWTAKDGTETGIDRVQEVQTYDVTGELVRVVDGEEIHCAWSYGRGRFFSEIQASTATRTQLVRDDFVIEPGCGVDDARFLPAALVLSGEEIRSQDGRAWIRGDRFEASERVSDLEDPDRTGQVTRTLAFWDPIRATAVPRGRCPDGPGVVGWVDADGDGIGRDDVGVLGCSLGPRVEGAGDCDDQDAARPAAEEICGNGLDDDCDGSAPTCEGPGGVRGLDTATWSGDAGEVDSLPRVFAVGDLDGDGLDDLALGQPTLDTEVGTDAGQVVLWTEGLEVETRIVGEAGGDVAGAWVGAIGDHTGDGRAELLVTATGTVRDGQVRSGTAYVLEAPYDDLDAAVARIEGRGDWLGTQAALLGTLDEDPWPDVAIGAQTSPIGGTNAGAVLIFAGPLTGALTPDDAVATVVGNRNDIVGDAIAGPGDVDGDGLDDLAVGRRLDGPDEEGAAHLVLAPFSGDTRLDDADVTWTGPLADGWAGERVERAGDLDQDGYADLLVAAPRVYGQAPREIASVGEVYVLYGGSALDDGALREAPAVIRGDRIFDVLGASVSGDFDHDGDGHPDIVLGAPGDDRGGSQAGVLAVFLGPVSGQLEASDADALLRGGPGAQVGTWVTSPGDVDGDGYDDVFTTGYLDGGPLRAQVFGIAGGPGW